MKNKRAERMDTRERILEESSKLFAEKGYSATSIEEIANCAGITKSVIYYHFKNKEDILQTLIQEAFAEFTRPEISAAHKRFHETGEQLTEVMKMLEFLQAERSKRIMKIVVMESLKQNAGELPLFKVWDLLVSTHQGFGVDHLQGLLMKDPQTMTKFFFQGFIPIISFFIFQERWCEHYKISSEQAWESYIGALEEYFNKAIK